MFAYTLLLAVVWGVCVACMLDIATLGHFITGHVVTEHMPWLIVSLGAIGDLLLVFLLVNGQGSVVWWQIGAILALSSLGLLARGILDFMAYYRIMLDIAQDVDGKQDVDGTQDVDVDYV